MPGPAFFFETFDSLGKPRPPTVPRLPEKSPRPSRHRRPSESLFQGCVNSCSPRVTSSRSAKFPIVCRIARRVRQKRVTPCTFLRGRAQSRCGCAHLKRASVKQGCFWECCGQSKPPRLSLFFPFSWSLEPCRVSEDAAPSTWVAGT